MKRDYWVTVKGYGRESVTKIRALSAADAEKQAADRYGISITVREKRTWTTVGAEFVERCGGQDKVNETIAALSWQRVGDGCKVGASQGLAIDTVIAEFGIPRVSRIAAGSIDGAADAEGDEIHAEVYGIEGRWANGRGRLFVADFAGSVTPICSDFYGDEREPDGQRVSDGGRVISTSR